MAIGFTSSRRTTLSRRRDEVYLDGESLPPSVSDRLTRITSRSAGTPLRSSTARFAAFPCDDFRAGLDEIRVFMNALNPLG